MYEGRQQHARNDVLLVHVSHSIESFSALFLYHESYFHRNDLSHRADLTVSFPGANERLPVN